MRGLGTFLAASGLHYFKRKLITTAKSPVLCFVTMVNICEVLCMDKQVGASLVARNKAKLLIMVPRVDDAKLSFLASALRTAAFLRTGTASSALARARRGVALAHGKHSN